MLILVFLFRLPPVQPIIVTSGDFQDLDFLSTPLYGPSVWSLQSDAGGQCPFRLGCCLQVAVSQLITHMVPVCH